MATIIGDGITFDDVLLVPSYSEVIPNHWLQIYGGNIKKRCCPNRNSTV